LKFLFTVFWIVVSAVFATAAASSDVSAASGADNGDCIFSMGATGDSNIVYALPQSVSVSSTDKLRDRRIRGRERQACFDSDCLPELLVSALTDSFYKDVLPFVGGRSVSLDKGFCGLSPNCAHSPCVCNLLI